MDSHANFAISSVATAPSPASSGTSLVVASGEGLRFPAVPFNATVWPANARPDPSNAEIIRVTARTTDSFGTIVRAQESSSARSIQVGDLVAATITAKSLTDIENDAAAVATYKELMHKPALFGPSVAANTFLFQTNSVVALASSGTGVTAFYLDPADYSVTGRTTKLRVKATILTNAVAPGVNFTFHLYPVATFGGASGASPTVATLGTSLGNVAINTPGASAGTTAATADFNFPAAGWHVLAVVNSGTTAANSSQNVTAELQMRQT